MSCSFIFCLHNHQPVGNFDHIFKLAFDKCYNKIMEVLSEYPEFHFAVHHSGPVLEWTKNNNPEYLERLREMNQKGQVEIIGGGFYEPIFSVITENDIKGQIELMQNFCKKEFGIFPKGFWTAERVWDPEIPNLVSGFGLDYTLLDDIHFRYAGIDEEDLYGYFITERLEKKLMIFPIDKFLRYAIPFRMPEETINYFKTRSEKKENAAFIYGDDGEKFGLWPETYKWVFEEKWLRKFVEAVLKENWIKTVHPSEYIQSNSPLGRVYLTQGSYFELSEWALPPKAALKITRINNEIKSWHRENDFYPFLKGGVWNNFLIKYPESNAINKRSILLSKEITQYEKKYGKKCGKEKSELYKGECNCAYWHGLFGGIYLNHLRHALYEHILNAEKIFLKRKKLKGISVIEDDLWNEGRKQILVRKKDMSAIIVPYMGGSIAEVGIYDKSFNILNVLPRRPEAYHEQLKELKDDFENNNENPNQPIVSIHDMIKVKEKNLKRYLKYDISRRYSFKDLILKKLPMPEDMMYGGAELIDLGLLEYDHTMFLNKKEVICTLSKKCVFDNDNVSIDKQFTVSDKMTGIRADYRVSGINTNYFAVELNMNLLAAHDSDRYYEITDVKQEDSFLDMPGISPCIQSFVLVDNFNKFRIKITTSLEAALVRYPVYTVSQSDSGFEKNFQGSCMVFIYKSDGSEKKFSIELSIE
jgi:4-alpha-glucanotransferase